MLFTEKVLVIYARLRTARDLWEPGSFAYTFRELGKDKQYGVSALLVNSSIKLSLFYIESSLHMNRRNKATLDLQSFEIKLVNPSRP